jgi:hypothetical protein
MYYRGQSRIRFCVIGINSFSLALPSAFASARTANIKPVDPSVQDMFLRADSDSQSFLVAVGLERES